MTQQPPLGWIQPESEANDENQPQYPYNNVTQSESGHSFEMDDTPGRERVRLQHRTGTFIEMHSDGDEVHKVYGNGYEITVKNKNIEVQGDCNITVRGDCKFHVEGNRIDQVDGDYSLVVTGKMAVVASKDLDLATRRDFNLQAGYGFGEGSFNFTTPNGLTIDGDLFIGGGLTADLITSVTRVDAGTGVSAGPLGFVSIEGGLSIGTPVALPGVIQCVGFVFSGIGVSTRIGSFDITSSVLSTDIVNTSLYNYHIHASPSGPTSPPSTRMV